MAVVAVVGLGALSSAAREVFPGPLPVVERVIDGDTLAVRARVWIGQELSVVVRLRGIDAPEMRSDCEVERELARRATDFLRIATETGPVTLSDISGGKYYGRGLATVTTAEGEDVALELERAKLARHYDGGARTEWCVPVR